MDVSRRLCVTLTRVAGERVPTVAALVLNYNGRDITLQALASLEAMSYPACELIHIDNGSGDGSSEAVAAAHPNVTQIRVEENQGVVYGMNKGIELAVDRGVDYLLLLNNDIEVEPDFLDELVAVAAADSLSAAWVRRSSTTGSGTGCGRPAAASAFASR